MTRFEDLGKHPEPAVTATEVSLTVAQVRDRAVELDQIVRLRDRVETWTALAVLPVFGWLAYRVPAPVAKVGALLIVLGCIITPLRLRAARGGAIDRTRPVVEVLRRERDWATSQRHLLASVGWWYLAPLLGGVALFFAGSRGPIGVKVAGITATALMGFVLLVANRRAAERELVPFIRQLDDTIRELHVTGGRHAD
jgi:hypothetical protein